MTLRLSTPMKTTLTAALGRAMRTPDGATVYQVDTYRAHRTVTALQRRGLVVMEARTVLDGNGKAHQATTSWLTAEGVKTAEKLRGPVAAPWAVAGVRAWTTAGKGEIIDRFVHRDGVEKVTFVPDGARAGDALAIDVRNPHLEPLCIRCDTTGDDTMQHRDTADGHLCGYCAAVLDGEQQRRGSVGAPVNTLAEFSREVADATATADDTVRVNREGRGAALSVGSARVLCRDNAYWRVAWVVDDGGRVIVCFWSASSNLDEPDERAQEAAQEPKETPAAQETQERPEDARAAVVAHLDAIWSKGYVTGPGLTLEQHRIAAEVIADHYTDGDTRKVFGRDRAALVADYRNRSTYDVMNAYGAVRLATGGDVWALVGKNRGGERPESLRPLVEEAVAWAGEVAVWSSTTTTAHGEEWKGADVIAPEAVTVFLAQELAKGHTVHRHARGALRVTCDSGAVVTLRPAGALAA
ncbi:hypothetical protein ACPCSE_29315 [Streptomyces cellulosae]